MQDPRGVSSLDLLERALADGETHAFTYFAFDLCFLDGHDLSGARLMDRKLALEGLVGGTVDTKSPIQISEHIDGDGEALFVQASRMGLEGIVSKKIDARYVQQRSAAWVKIKRVDVGAFVVIGYLSNGPGMASSLILAEDRDGELVYVGRVGSGIGDAKARELHAMLSKIPRAGPVTAASRTAGAQWVEPRWSAEIGYRSRSTQGSPRAPVFLGYSARKVPRGSRSLKPRLVGDRDLAAIQLTNPEREIFAGSGVTKLDVALHYARVGDWLLPELLHRPLTMLRCPSGDIKDCFYQRHAFAGLPAGIGAIDLADEEGRGAFVTVTEAKGYLALAQFGAIEFHLWGCRVDDPEHPDRLVMDLDPDADLPWARVCDGAEILRDRLEAMGFRPFLRTTGGKGLHLVMALDEGHDWRTVKGFAEALARSMASDAPNLFTAVSSKERRKGRIYLDYLRNGRGATAVASYSLRARPGFPVATPIAWEELRKLSGGNVFNRLNIHRRLDGLAADPWNELGSSAVKITPKMQRGVGMKT